jgi:hypothetical protein
MEKRQNFLLVIGIDEYLSPNWSNLNNAVRDAKDVAKLLIERYGFELLGQPLYNAKATRENISQLFANAVTQLMEGDNLIIYFAGHGFMNPMTRKGFWVPYEADLKPTEMISNSEIKDFIEVLPAKHILLLSDSCFSGTFITRTRGILKTEAYTNLGQKKSRWVLTSGHEETVSDGKSGEGSPFARNLIRFLAENINSYASVGELVRYVCAMTISASSQRPQGAAISNVGDEEGQLIFRLEAEFVKTNVLKSDGNPATQILRNELRAVYRAKSNYAAGKEVALVDFLSDPNSLLLMENFRYDDDGKKKLLFKDGMVIMAGKEGPSEFPVIARAATYEGMIRYMKENEAALKKYKVVQWPAHESIDQVESTGIVMEHREFIQDLMDQNQNPMQCLHCGKMISTNDSYSVEIDEEGLRPNAGNVHKECLRSVDRMIGRAMMPEVTPTHLINFDYLKWFELLKTGQGFISGALKTSGKHSGAVISWNREHNFNIGEYSIKMHLADGSASYMMVGKDIQRYTSDEIDKEVEKMNTQREIFGLLSNTKLFGDVEYLDSIKTTEEIVIPIEKYSKVRYSNQLDVKENDLSNDYAPLGLLQGADGRIISFGNIIPIITDPLKFDELYGNWKSCGYVDRPCTLQILENDKEVDFYLMGFFNDEMIPVLDPQFSPDKNLTEGLSIMKMNDIIAMKHLFKRKSQYE